MSEHPIIFSPESIRAIYAGSKTQTRRVIGKREVRQFNKIDPTYRGVDAIHQGVDALADTWGEYANIPDAELYTDALELKRRLWRLCPYGVPGDTLWVREAWRLAALGGQFPYTKEWYDIQYRQDSSYRKIKFERKPHLSNGRGNGFRWRPSIHMFKWMCRLFLTVKSIRVQRLQDITVNDIRAEGLSFKQEFFEPFNVFVKCWDTINAKRGFGWDMNPWVWVVEFERSK